MALHDMLMIQENASGQLEKRILGAAANGKVLLINGSNEPTLAELGVPPYDIVRVQGQRGEFTFLLADDRQAVMG